MEPQVIDRILQAFKNEKHEWRTIRGIANEARVNVEQVKSYISENGDLVVKSSAKNNDGEALYTLRDKYRRETSFASQMSSIFRNRGA